MKGPLLKAEEMANLYYQDLFNKRTGIYLVLRRAFQVKTRVIYICYIINIVYRDMEQFRNITLPHKVSEPQLYF